MSTDRKPLGHDLPSVVAEPAPLLEDGDSDSHALATAEPEEYGYAQLDHDEDTANDLGWHGDFDEIPQPLIGGLTNQQLWMLLRRFNKQILHVKALSEPPQGGLDLNVAEEDDFSPAKMRNNIERLYYTVIIGMISAFKHAGRLSSWNERKRTAIFCTAYFVSWFFNFLFPLLFSLVVILITYPRARTFIFPSAPLALVSMDGSLKQPPAGMLGSDNTLTGAPEKYEGEAVEQEASNFVSAFTAISISSATGEHVSTTTTGHEDDKAPVEDPAAIASSALDAKKTIAGKDASTKTDKTKAPMEEEMWKKTRPVMHAIGDLADTWERFGNLLSPTPPFRKNAGRVKLAGIFAPLILSSLFTSGHMFIKINSFAVGAAFFGQPLIARGIAYLNSKYPKWQQLLELRNSILKGIPTNAQLAVTLLRIGETNKAPLPPPPPVGDVPPTEPIDVNMDELPIDAPEADVQQAINPSKEYLKDVEDEKHELKTGKPKDGKSKAGNRALNILKKVTGTVMSAKLGADSLKAKAGNLPAKNRLGAIPSPDWKPRSGPIKFNGRHKGKHGTLYLDTASDSPFIFFQYASAKDDAPAVFSVKISDIVEVQKVGVLGWKTKIVVGWAMQREVADAIRIGDRFGNQHLVTAVELQEELFNRLIAMGGQLWESW